MKKKQFNGGFSKIWAIIAVLPALFIFLMFNIIPSFMNVFISLTDFSGFLNTPINWVGVQNYITAFTMMSDDVLMAIRITMIFSVSITIFLNIIALLLAVLVNMKLKLRNFYRAIFFMPSILGTVVIGLIWTLILDPFTGPVSKVLSIFNMDSALLGDPKQALFLLIIVMLWANFGYTMVLYLAGLQRVPNELYESGKIDGTNAWTQLRFITIPLIRPVITINLLICVIGTLKQYDLIFVLTGGGPIRTTTTLAMYIFDQLSGTNTISMGFVSALTIILFVIVLVAVLIVKKITSRKEDGLS